MVAEQLEKLKTEKEERARAGAATPPSPAPSNDSADNRHILQPVDNPESPDSGSQVEFWNNSPVHVVLVSVLVDQLSGLFLIFLVDQKKLSSLSEFLVSLWEFLVNQKKNWSTKKNEK